MSPAAPLPSVAAMTTQTVTPSTTHAPRFARARNLPLAVVVRVLLTMLAMMGASFAVSVGVSELLGSFYETTPGTMTVYLTVCLAGTLFAWTLRRFFEGDRSGHIAAGWHGGRAVGWFGLGLLAAVLAAGSAQVICLLAGWTSLHAGEPAPLSAWLTGMMIIIGVSVLLQGIPEEMLWRGYFQTTVAERLRPWTAAIVGAVCFGSMHVLSIGSGDTWASNLIYVFMASGLGLACAGMRTLTGSVWAAAGVHGGMHIVNRTLRNWISDGNDFAFTATLGVTMGLVFVACWLIHRARQGAGNTSTAGDASAH